MQELFIIKIGGNIIDSPDFLQAFLKQIACRKERIILVHGGGKLATAIGSKMGIESHYIDGRRITDEAILNLVTMVYGGLINRTIVAMLQAAARKSIGIAGADANLLPAKKRPVSPNGINFGFAGDIEPDAIDTVSWHNLLNTGWLPVVAPLTHDEQGQLLNTNADTIATVLATALSKIYKTSLILCFEKKGVLEHVDDDQSVIGKITEQTYRQLKSHNRINAGMLPKLEGALKAVAAGVQTVIIGSGLDITAHIEGQSPGTLICNS